MRLERVNVNLYLRIWLAGLIGLLAVGALIGWALGEDPSPLAGIIGTVGIAFAGAEAGNVGKRWTYRAPPVMGRGAPDRFHDDERG